MINLQVSLKLLPEKEGEFLNIFSTQFAPAMARQTGFIRTSLLKQREAESKYRIDIVFDSEEQRLAWVNTEEHQKIWPRLASLIDDYSATGFKFLTEKT